MLNNIVMYFNTKYDDGGIFKSITNNRFVTECNECDNSYNFCNFEYILDCNINIINLIILRNSM